MKVKPSRPPAADGQRHRRAQGEHDGEERARRAVQEERESDEQRAEDRERAQRRLRRLPLEPRGDVGHANPAHRPRAARAHGAVDPGERRVALGGPVHVEVHQHAQKMVAHERLLPEEPRPAAERPELRRARAGARPPEHVEHGERGDVRHAPERLPQAVHATHRVRRPGVVRLEDEQRRLGLREDPLEGAGRRIVRVARDHEPVEGALARDARDHQRCEGDQHGVERKHRATPAKHRRSKRTIRSGSEAGPRLGIGGEDKRRSSWHGPGGEATKW